MAEIEIGNLKIINSTQIVAIATDTAFNFPVPPGGVGLMKESTFHLFRGGPTNPQAQAGNTCDPFTSDLVRVKGLEVLKQGSSERTNLLSGTPNIKEFAGTGQLSKLFTVIETLENNENVIVTVRNDDTVVVEVSLTLWFAVKPRERRIAGQGAPTEQEAERIRRETQRSY
jgi:hypothetical protein